MPQEGYVKLHRSILEWDWWSDANTTRLFIFLLLSATHQELSYRGITLKPGDYVSSVRQLAVKTGLSVQNTRTALNHLFSTHEVTQCKHPKFTVYTVENWAKYQSGNTVTDTRPTQNQHRTNTEPTQEQECKNVRMKEYIEKENKEKEKPKKRSASFSKPALSEVKAYCLEMNLSLVDPEKFVTYYESNGWKVGKNPMKNWHAAIAGWQKREEEKRPKHPTGYYDQNGKWTQEAEWEQWLRDI